MALKDVLVKPTKHRPKSWLELMSEQLDKEDYDWLLACIHNTAEYSGSYIAQKLTEAGHAVSPTTINNIRKTL